MEGPSEPPATTRRGDAGLILLLLALALPLLLYRLGAKDVWEASEGRPLESAREMSEHGDHLVQYTNGDVDLTKPPVYAWLTGLAFHWTGMTGKDAEWAGRLPSVLASIGILLLTFRLGRRAAGSRAGFLSALLLLTQWKFTMQARLAELETLLALGVLTAYSALASALDVTPGAPGGAGRGRAFALFHLGLGFAFAVKGPIALLLVLPGTVVCAFAARRARTLLSGAFLGTAPIALVVGLAWYVAVVVSGVWADGKPALDTFLSYAKGENVGHLHGPLLYLWEYPLAALPWTPLVLLGFALPFSKGAPPATRDVARFLLAAFATTFVVLSCLGPKQTHYLIPIFPLAAILGGAYLDRAIGGAGRLGALLARVGRPERVVAAAFAVVLGVFAWGFGHYVPSMNREQSSRDFMAHVSATVPPGAALAWTVFGSHSDYLWYLPMRLVGRAGIPDLTGPGKKTEEQIVADTRRFLSGQGARYAIVTSEQADALAGSASVLFRDTLQKKGRKVALVTNATIEPRGGGPRSGR